MDINVERYIINHTAFGYSQLNVTDTNSIANITDSVVVVVVDKTTTNQLYKYYTAIETFEKNNNRVMVIGTKEVNDDLDAFKSLASLVVKNGGYDVYIAEEFSDKNDITSQYLTTLEKRDPDLSEVKTFISGDIIACNQLDSIVIGIETLVKEGSLEGLAQFIENRSESVESLTTAFNILKIKSNAFDKQDLFKKVAELTEEKEVLNKMIDESEDETNKIRFENEQFSIKVNELTKQLSKLQDQANSSQNSSSSNSIVMKDYTEINTQLINCKAKIVLYFKEISYVTYSNTLIGMIVEYLNKKKLKVKTLIYDSSTGLYGTYSPLPVITGKDYAASKTQLINTNDKIVVAEPFPGIIEDVLMSDNAFDVVIIYDRIKHKPDIIKGNNVTKFFIINSKGDYEKTKKDLDIIDTSHIISRADCCIYNDSNKADFIDIPTVKDFTNSTSSAKISKYFKMSTTITKQPLIDTIIKMAKIDTLF